MVVAQKKNNSYIWCVFCVCQQSGAGNVCWHIKKKTPAKKESLQKKCEEDFVSASSLVVAAEKSSQRAPSPLQLCSCALCTV